MRVEDVMTRDVATARAEMSLKEAAREMAAHGISSMPVIDDDLHVIGVISEADLLAKERTGGVRRQSHAQLVAKVVRKIPGVVDVRSELTWAEPE
jgi:CBS-domain-containing membrane protein